MRKIVEAVAKVPYDLIVGRPPRRTPSLARPACRFTETPDKRLLQPLLVVLWTVCLLASRAQCETPAQTASNISQKPHATVSPRQLPAGRNYEAGPAKFDVCSLLKADEIEKVSGSSIEQSKRSEHSDGGLRVSQCVYLASQPNKSVSLVVTKTDSRSGSEHTARDLWLERFGRYREGQREKKEEDTRAKETEEEREGRPPRKIIGLGEEAFWTAGSLYVLKKDVFLRLSLGGPDSEAIKLQHSKSLASVALKRLQLGSGR